MVPPSASSVLYVTYCYLNWQISLRRREITQGQGWPNRLQSAYYYEMLSRLVHILWTAVGQRLFLLPATATGLLYWLGLFGLESKSIPLAWLIYPLPILAWLVVGLMRQAILLKKKVDLGQSDSMAPAYDVLVQALDPSHVYTSNGGHNWKTWKPLWARIAAELEVSRGN